MFGSPLGFIAPPATAPAHDYTAFYLFDEGSGTTLGDQSGSHNGTISNCTWDASDKPTGAAASLVFDHTAASRVALSPMLPNVADMAVSFWFKTAGAAPTGSFLSWGQAAGTNDRQAFTHVKYGWDSLLQVETYAPPSTHVTWSGAPFANSAWHHVVINWAAGFEGIKFYVDNVWQLSVTEPPISASKTVDTSDLGGWFNSVWVPEFSGRMTCLSFYERALTVPEIALMYADPTYAP